RLKAEWVTHAALCPDESVFDPEIIVAGAAGGIAVVGIALVAPPFCVHGSGLYPRNRPDSPLRRSCDERRQVSAHRVPACRHVAPGIGGRIVVVERHQRDDVPVLEGLKPSAEKVERILRRASRHIREIAYGKYDEAER